MTLDVPTLTFAGAVGALASGLLLLLNWWQDRDASPALWWGLANCGLGVGTGLLAFHDTLALFVWQILAPPILDVCAVATWVAARTFNRGRVRPARVAIMTLSWVSTETVVRVLAGEAWGGALGLGVSAVLYLAGAFEFWRARTEPLRGRWSMIALLALYTLALCLASAQYNVFGGTGAAPLTGWIGMIHFAGLIYALGSSTFLLSMLRDRSERQHRTAAMTDPLTGLPNRRAFEELARRIVAGGLRDGSPVAVIAFDLDHFKQINDAYGHPVGDAVLQAFGEVLRRTVRSVDAVGRTGGEEFIAVLPQCDLTNAVAAAGRIRIAFQAHAQSVAGRPVRATVSAGVSALGAQPTSSLSHLIEQADTALYRAKRLGRNRVATVEDAEAFPVEASVLRVA